LRPSVDSLLAACLALPLLVAVPTPETPPTITFLVASDSHFGARGMSELNRVAVQHMNALPGTEYPPEMGGTVDTPRGVLFTGDTTDNGSLEEFAEFESVYGLTGEDGLLRFPIFEAIGNHDVNETSPVKERERLRHGGIDYSWDWDDLHLVCLDMYPDRRTQEWLLRDLELVGPDRPVILFFHYSLEGPYSDFWEESEKDSFARAIEGRNVLAIFHGHEHRVGHYFWRGHPVFRPGAPRHRSHFFLAVRVGPETMDVAAWDWDVGAWLTSWRVPVRR
jgi:cytolysin (calcineurin-like family phosphatase)